MLGCLPTSSPPPIAVREFDAVFDLSWALRDLVPPPESSASTPPKPELKQDLKSRRTEMERSRVDALAAGPILDMLRELTRGVEKRS